MNGSYRGAAGVYCAAGGKVPFEKTSVRLWKRLEREERLAAATAFWAEPAREVVGTAVEKIAQARRMRPQTVPKMSDAERSGALAGLLDPGEPLAASLLVSLHLSRRRPLLGAFLDALGLPHQEGVLGEEPDAGVPVTREAARAAVEAIRAAHPPRDVAVYLNTLWLQDPERWSALADPDLELPEP
jgi:hypothetical protein